MASCAAHLNPWPPGCCVAAFVHAALCELRPGRHIDKSEVAAALGTLVGPTECNPWSLPVTFDSSSRGVSAAAASERIPTLLRDVDRRLGFRHIRFRWVTLGLYPDLLRDIRGRRCVCGVGFDRAVVFPQEAALRHVCRVAPGPSERFAVLLDDAMGAPPPRHTIPWDLLEVAVLTVDDGFWVVGETDSLDFGLAPRQPVRSSE
jgi:hypothetical protein